MKPFKTIYIAHAGGGFNGTAYTNAAEAFIQADQSGFTYAEIDFCRTADGDYAAVHDWHTTYKTKYDGRSDRPVPTASEFLRSKPKYKGTSLTLKKGFGKVLKKTKLKFLIDAKHDLLKVCDIIRTKFPDEVHRIIPQAFTFREYEKLRQFFPEVILILYRSRRTEEAVINFCRKNKPFAVAVSREKAVGFYLSKQLQALNVRAFCHTINDRNTAQSFQKNGFCGFYTDFLSSNGKKNTKTEDSA
ncbi:MAG: hypothetical protein KC649_01360 [Candidatus Omnitrophica bacterium]|nr:hypothetical protein [Candidatus Omnitrophota bacterium]